MVLGLVMRLRDGEDTYAYVYTAAHDALRRLGACWSDDAARRAVERTLTGVLSDALQRVTRPRGTSRGRTPFRP